MVPGIQLPGLHEVGVAAKQDRAEPAAPAQGDRLVQILIRLLVAGTIRRTIDQVQRFLGVGQRDHQRVVSPLPVVADVHPALALTQRRGNRAVGVDHRAIEELLLLLLPDSQANFVDRLHQRHHLLIGLESPAEVAGRCRIGNPLRAQCIQINLVVAKRLQILKAPAVARDVVGDVQHMIRFVIRQMHLEQMHVFVNGIDQPDLARQQMHRANPAMTKPPRAVGHVVADVAGREHRTLAGTPHAS